MAESCVSFSILTDKNGELKITLDSAEKNFSSDTFSQGLSPSPSIKSLNSTNNSEDLCAGKRRRIVSSSTESLLTTDSFFDNEEVVLRSSTPVSESSDETESLSDVSFTSCVSRVSELSIMTSSSQETVTSKNISYLKEKNVNNLSEMRYGPRRKSVTYEETNKERYGGWAEGDWRSAMKPKETKVPAPNAYKSNTSTGHSSFIKNASFQGSDRSNYKSRIPALADRPSYHSPSSGRFYPAKPVAYSAKSQLSNQSASQNVPLNNVQKPIKLVIATDSNGNMKIRFSNQKTDESWSISGASELSERIDVCKIAVPSHK